MKNCLFYKLFVLFIISMVIFLNPIFAQETDNFIEEYNSLSDSWRNENLHKLQERLSEKELEEKREVMEHETNGKIEKIETRYYKSGNNLGKLVMSDQTKGMVYPGSLLWADALINGRLLPFPRLSAMPDIKAVLLGVRINSECKVNRTLEFNGTLSSYQESIDKLLPCISATAPLISFTISDATRLDTALLDFGMSARYWSSEIGGKLHSGRTDNKSFIAISLDQVFFSTETDTPPDQGYLPMSGFKDLNFGHYILNTAKTQGEVAYVRKVDYGHRLILTVTSESSQQDLRRALSFSTSGPRLKLAAKIDNEIQNVWDSLDVRAHIVGGKVSSGLINAITGDPKHILENINAYLQETATLDSETVAIPVSFEVSFTRDNEPLVIYETIEYSGEIKTGKVCNEREESVRPNTEITTSYNHVRITNGDDEFQSDDWSSVKIDYKVKQSRDNRRLYLSLKWIANELESNRAWKPHKDGGNRSEFKSSRTFKIYEVPSDCPESKILSLSNITPSGSRTEYYSGQVWGDASFPDFGSLSNISVSFDHQGRGDNQVTGLKATLQGFTVKISKEPW
jgi:hypothetical protein